MRVKVDSGKYEVVFENGHLQALRWGEPWRELVGDNLVYFLACELETSREEVDKLKKRNEELFQMISGLTEKLKKLEYNPC